MFSPEFYRHYCETCWPPTSLSRDLVTVPGVGVFRVKSCAVHGPVLVEAVVRFETPPKEVNPCQPNQAPATMQSHSDGGSATPK